uniref:Tail-anchored protein insertion receptor WRB isoform X3 n=1 Tax=Petromyzon marinus TaxID=7757 RepID=A0AAJ7XBI1_PETMA|nr:tail-anchored protein insertion receptor WRB isoform X3 [Petromyzon marinus]
MMGRVNVKDMKRLTKCGAADAAGLRTGAGAEGGTAEDAAGACHHQRYGRVCALRPLGAAHQQGQRRAEDLACVPPFTPLPAASVGLVQARTTQLTTMKWIINISFYTLQAVVMITLIWNYYSTPVAMLPSKWVSPLEKLVAFPTGVPGGIGITCWLLVCNKIAGLLFQPFT